MTCKCGKEMAEIDEHEFYCKCGRFLKYVFEAGERWYEPDRPTVTDEEIEQAAFSQSVKFSGMDYFRDGAMWMRERIK